MAKKLTKKQNGGESTPSNRQKRLSNRADKAFNKAGAAQKELNKTFVTRVDLGPVDPEKPWGTRLAYDKQEKVYDLPGYGKKRGQLEKTVGKNMDKVNRLSQKATSLKKKK
jgi:hypothetical protein